MTISSSMQICTQLAKYFCDVGERHGFTPILQLKDLDSLQQSLHWMLENDKNDHLAEAYSDDAEENFDKTWRVLRNNLRIWELEILRNIGKDLERLGVAWICWATEVC